MTIRKKLEDIEIKEKAKAWGAPSKRGKSYIPQDIIILSKKIDLLADELENLIREIRSKN